MRTWVGPILLASFVLGGGVLGCARGASENDANEKRAKQEELKPIQASTTEVVLRPMPRYVTLTGSLVADRKSAVAADVSGKVLSSLVDRGSVVKAGAVLMVLDKRSATLRSREAAANVELARSQAALAREECARADGLLASGALGKAEYDRIKNQCETSTSSFEAAQARREAALQSLGDAVIKAPFAGIVSERLVNVGEYVQPQTQVVQLVAADPIRLQLNVPEALLGNVGPNTPVELSVSAYPDQWFKGAIQYLSASLRERTRDLLVEAVVPNPEQKLRPGMFALARLPLPKAEAPVVPLASVKVEGELARLFVDREGTLEERIVELGAKDGDIVEIRKGVTRGEAVVSPFPSEAKDGARIAAR
jgi:membrane fusion protein (multidrug efflux system)